MTKVTFCVYDKPDSVGGPVTWIQRLVPALRERGIEPACLFLLHWGDTGVALEALRAQGIDCRSTLASDRTKDRVRWILSELERQPPDVFVPNLVPAGFFAGRWARSAGIPTIGVLHSDDQYYRAIQDEFVFGAKRDRVSAIVCVSRELERQVLNRHPADTIVRRIPYGVPIPQRKRPDKMRPLRIAYVGRLAEEQKRISEVTRALCHATASVPGTEAVIFGDGPDRNTVEKILSGASKNSLVTLAGAVSPDHVQEELLRCDVIVLLSDYEGLPIAFLEGMACGCIPVALRMRSGIPELVEDGLTGLLVDDRDRDFVAAIRRLRNDADLRARLSNAARELIVSNFAEDVSADRWASLIGELASLSRSRSQLEVPPRIVLPSRNPALEDESARSSGPSLARRLYRRGRMLAGRVKQVLR
jgi:glycosyltransferase involved in cell wall biosynthesis